ncbi:MAG: hypothetical protein LIO94_09140, partial [Clostridiales bacterium]|nr:hypothetical protein [Clostridiales bacterium]
GGLDQDTEDVLVLSGTSEANLSDIYSEALKGYEIVYLTKSYALWARTDSVICGGLENAVLARVETLVRDTDAEEEAAEEAETEEEETESVTNSESEVQTESETESQTSGKEALESGIQIYGGDVILTSGTYQADLYLQVDESEALSGVITVSDSSGTLCTVDFDETIFDENGAGIVSVQFTSRSIMRSVTIEVTGTAMTVATVEQFVYYKLSSAYTVGLGIENRVSRAVKIIKKLDKKCKTEGTVTWIDHHAEETEELSTNVFEAYLPGYEVTAALECEAESITSEYVIGMTVYHSWYTLMDRYSIVYRTSAYTVLVRNDSAQYKKYVKLNGNTLSNGTKINIEAFTGEASADTPISLEKGDYNYCVSVTCNVESLTGKSDAGAGVLSIMSGEELLAQKEITYADLLSGTLPEGENSICTEISIPLSLQVKTSDITCIAEMNDGISVTVQPTAIELTSQNYVYGRDESQLAQLLEKINSLDEEIVVNVLQTDTVIWNQNVDYTWLQEQLAGRTVEELSYSKANSMTEDTVLLTYGLFANILNLLNNYSIVGHAGKYTLWARNNGEALQELVESGLSILNSGKKLSLSSIAAMSGTSEMENVIESLPSAQYNVYLELTASDISSDDTIEVYLLRDKTENERSEDIDELIESGYTEEEASEWTDTQETCGSTTIGTYQINDSGKLLVTIKTSKAMELTNLTCEAYTWHNSEVEAKILWVEMVS